MPPLPDGAPDMVVDYPTLPQAALIYRLSGDLNPLHSDPAVARQAGFARPILHGYCTYAIAGWVIIRTFLDCNPDRLAALDGRFSAPVFPGETLRVEMWKAAEGVRFRVRVLERDVIAMTNGVARTRG
jgi:acyl dehydratase